MTTNSHETFTTCTNCPMIIDQSQPPNNSTPSQHRRRKKKLAHDVNQYFSSHVIPTVSSYDNSKDYNGIGVIHGYRNQFLIRVMASFVIVWSFFIFVKVDTNGNTNEPNEQLNPAVNVILDIQDNINKQIHMNENIKSLRGKIKGKSKHDTITTITTSNHNTKNTSHDKSNQKPKIIIKNKDNNNASSNSKAAFIIVATKYLADPIKSTTNAIESIFKNTNRDRILCIVPVFSHSLLIEYGLQASEVREYFEQDLDNYLLDGVHSNTSGDSADGDGKEVSRSRGNFRGTGRKNAQTIEKKQSNQRKIKLIIEEDDDDSTKRRNGVAQSRRNAAQFIQNLHEEEQSQRERDGGKSDNEEVILTLLRPDSEIHKHDWLEIVSDALLGPIPFYTKDNESFHYHNAISFALSQKTRLQQHMTDRKNKHHPHYHHHYNQRYISDHSHNSKSNRYTTTSLDTHLTPVHTTTPLKSDIELTNGRSYPSPILEGSATSLLLSTFLQLNSNLNVQNSNKYLTSTVAADIELSLNLWLCGSGIDIISDLHVEKNVLLMKKERDYVREEEKMWLIHEWMSTDDEIKRRFDNRTIVRDNHTTIPLFNTTGEKLLQRLNNTNIIDSFFNEHKDQITSQRDKLKKCRTFDWWMKEVNILMDNQLRVNQNHLDEKKDVKTNKTRKKKKMVKKIIMKKRMS